MSSWDLVKSGQYTDAVAAFSEEIRARPSDAPSYSNRGMAYLHLGDYEAALTDFRSADALHSAALNSVSAGEMCGVALWMAGRETEAAATWSAGVDASLSGAVRYGDAAGGVTVGNLLFFAGVRLPDPNAVALATRFLKKRLRTRQSAAWPGPASRCLLGLILESEMLAAVSTTPILRERQMCQARFTIGVRALAAGDRDTYTDAMHQAYDLGSVSRLEADYYLALHEQRSGEPGTA